MNLILIVEQCKESLDVKSLHKEPLIQTKQWSVWCNSKAMFFDIVFYYETEHYGEKMQTKQNPFIVK